MPDRRLNIFVSYSHQDAAHLERLKVHLESLNRLPIDPWDDTRIRPGSEWKADIEKALQSAACAVLLISGDFLASHFIKTKELPQILERQKTDGLVVLPVMVGPAYLDTYPEILHVQMVNTPTTPLSKMLKADREDVWVKLARIVHEMAKGVSVPDPESPETDPEADKIYVDVVALMRHVLTNNPRLAGELQEIVDPSGCDLLGHILTTPSVELLAKLHGWLKEPRQHGRLDDIRTIVNAIAVLGVNCNVVKSLRSLMGSGTISISDALEGSRSAELLIAAILNRPASYVSGTGAIRGRNEIPASRRVASSGVFREDHANEYRSMLLAYFSINEGPYADDLMFKAMTARWRINDPVYTVLSKDEREIPAYLKKYRWEALWLKVQSTENGPWAVECTDIFEIAVLLGEIYPIIDSLSARQGQTQ